MQKMFSAKQLQALSLIFMYTKEQLIAFIRWYDFQPSTFKLHTPLHKLIDFYFENLEQKQDDNNEEIVL